MAILAGHGQGFFRVGIFVSADGRQIDFCVRFWHGEVDHDLYIWISQQVFDGTDSGDVEFLGLRLCFAMVNIRTGCDFKYVKGAAILDVGAKNVTGAYDTDFNPCFHGLNLLR